MMLKNISSILFATLCFNISVVMAAPVLVGKMTQGSLIRAKIAAGSQVSLNGEPLQVTPNGEFVFGFGRDAKLNNELTWKMSSETQWQSMPLAISKREYKIDKIEGVAAKYVSPPDEVLARIRSDNRAIAQARARFTESNEFTQDFILPAKGRVSGVYGSQRVFNGQAKRPHYGLDIANKIGTPIVAPASGIIRLAHSDMYYSGGTLILDHGYGVSSTFIHLSKLHVFDGQRVQKGELIAEIGATGRVTGAHLDWRINWYQERLDPALLVELPAP